MMDDGTEVVIKFQNGMPIGQWAVTQDNSDKVTTGRVIAQFAHKNDAESFAMLMAHSFPTNGYAVWPVQSTYSTLHPAYMADRYVVPEFRKVESRHVAAV